MDTESCTPYRHQVSPDTRLHRAHGLAVGVARLHPGVEDALPDLGQLLESGAEQVDALSAGDLGVQAEVLGDAAERDELRRRDLATRHPGNHRVRTVLLHVGQRVVVGVLGLALAGIEHVAVGAAGENRGHRRPADLAATAGAVCVQHRAPAAVPVDADEVEQALAGHLEVLAQRVADLLARGPQLVLQQRRDHGDAPGTARAGRGAGLQLIDGAGTLGDGGAQRCRPRRSRTNTRRRRRAATRSPAARWTGATQDDRSCGVSISPRAMSRSCW